MADVEKECLISVSQTRGSQENHRKYCVAMVHCRYDANMIGESWTARHSRPSPSRAVWSGGGVHPREGPGERVVRVCQQRKSTRV